MTLKRLPHESVDDFQFRLCDNREQYELSWQQVADILNSEFGQNFNESTYRKKYAAFKQGYEYALNNTTPSDQLSDLEKKRIELEEERKRLQTVKLEYNKISRENARFDLLVESILTSIQSLPSPTIEPMEYKRESDSEWIFSLSDVHYGKKFSIESNKYNTAIAEKRLWSTLSELKHHVQEKGIKRLHVNNLGDSIEGMTLRVSQTKSLEIGFVDQVMQWSDFFAVWLNELSKFVEVELHYVTSSNHTEIRPFNTGRGEYVSEDMERIVAHYIKAKLQNNHRIKIHTYENGIGIYTLNSGFNVLVMHGHQAKGIEKLIHNYSMQKRVFIDYVFIGHFHHSRTVTVGNGYTHNLQVIACPSVMGSDEYSEQLCRGAKAGTTLCEFNEKGKIAQYDLVL